MSTPYTDAVLADNPTLLWRLNEPSGTNADDSTANNNDGIHTGSPALNQAALSLDDGAASIAYNGSSQYTAIILGDVAIAYPFTMEGLVLKGVGGANSSLLSVARTDSTRWFVLLGTDAAGDLRITHAIDTATATAVVATGANIEDSQPHHIAAVFETSTSRRIYLDGVEVLHDTNNAPISNFATAISFSGAVLLRLAPVVYTACRLEGVSLHLGEALSAARVAAHASAALTPASGGGGGVVLGGGVGGLIC